jgi:hypothetical protein
MADPALLRMLAVVALVALTVAVGLLVRRREGTVRTQSQGRWEPHELAAVGIGEPRTDAAVRAVLLGSPTCAPCASVRRVLGEVGSERDGFTWVSVDAGEHLELTRTHHVMRVPTLFVLDADGRILARTSGVPAARDLVEVIDRAGG